MANTSKDAGTGQKAGSVGIFKSPTQMVVVVTLALTIPFAVIGYMVGAVSTSSRDNEMSAEAIEARIRPVAGFELGEAKRGGPARAGDVVYKEACAACHATGVSGAPTFGDKDAWEARIELGLDTLIKSASEGKNAMPAQAGSAYSVQEVANAVVYMANEGGASFEAPKLEEESAEGESQ